MRPTLFLALACAASPVRLSGAPARVVSADSTSAPRANDVYDGRSGKTRVKPPRLEETGSAMDGALDEPQWSAAALLTGFSQFSPTDGVPADGFDRGARLVFADGDPLRHSRVRAARRRCARRSPIATRSTRDDNIQHPARHLQRRAAGDRCSPSTRSACRRTARSSRATQSRGGGFGGVDAGARARPT